jgi:hypothetical protein
MLTAGSPGRAAVPPDAAWAEGAAGAGGGAFVMGVFVVGAGEGVAGDGAGEGVAAGVGVPPGAVAGAREKLRARPSPKGVPLQPVSRHGSVKPPASRAQRGRGRSISRRRV